MWPRGESPANAFCGEDERLAVLAAYGTSELARDPELERIAGFAAHLCGTPVALVSLVESERQRFLARSGTELLETPRPVSFCAHAMLRAETMIVCDATADPRFADNPLVTSAPHIRFYAGSPLVSAEGAPLGALCVIDTVPRPEGLSALQAEGLAVLADAVMRRLQSQRESLSAGGVIAEREERLRSIIDSVPGVAWSADCQANFDYFSARWHEVTGQDPPKVAADWNRFVHPEDFAATAASFTKAIGDVAPFECQFRLLQADGSWRWVLSRAVPLGDDLRNARWFGTMIDVDEAHRLSESRDLLASELSHRIKNIFAVVSGLIALRSRGASDVGAFARELTAAIKALSTAHDYVRPIEGRSPERLLGLLEDLLAPYDKHGGERIAIDGDDVAIGAGAATPLALIFHELATNSAKYGALARADGEVVVTVITQCEGKDRLCVAWRESVPGYTPPADPDHEGFGTRLLRSAVEGQLGGKFTRMFSDDGLDIEIAVPLESIAR